jgi:Ni,Fe-hydrogenase III large subunit
MILSPEEWQQRDGKLIALWTDAVYAYALYQPQMLVAVELVDGSYPTLSNRHAGAGWFERLARDLNGHKAIGAADTRPAIEQHRGPDGNAAWPDFAPAAGEGVHEVAVGPVHAGIIEPGHFQFSVLGEKVLKLETRLGYSHKGTLAMIRGKSPRLAARFAARVSGDATVAHGLAFARAAEAALALQPPPRAIYLRAVMAEVERIANHAGDLGGIAGDAGFAFLEARFGRHRESFCAAAQAAFGHRLMMDVVIPGGVAGDMKTGGAAALLGAISALDAELPKLLRVYEDYASLQDRLVGTGMITPELAASFGAGGVVGRASGQSQDMRVDPGYAPYDALALNVPVRSDGDVAARTRIRLAELEESMRVIRLLLETMPEGQIAVAPPSGTGTGLGVAESFRGPVWHWLNIQAGSIADVFIVDPSTLHWPLLEHAARSGILADFPLINKSINASYSGVDL